MGVIPTGAEDLLSSSLGGQEDNSTQISNTVE